MSWAPHLPLWALGALAALLVAALLPFPRLAGQGGRLLAGALLLTVLAGPLKQEIEGTPLSDVVIVLRDESASNRLGERAQQTALPLELEEAEIIEVSAVEGPRGTEVMPPLRDTLRRIDPDRVAAIVLISDGQVIDQGMLPEIGAPVHVLLTGSAAERDLRLMAEAPDYGLVGETVPLTFTATGAAEMELRLWRNGAEETHRLTEGAPLEIPLTLERAGRHQIFAELAPLEGELTVANNRVALEVTAAKERMRVLLVSGRPYPGGRALRGFLKSDPAVDLVHFTILRTIDKYDGVPESELALIAFPTETLFEELLDQFDLVIFDRFEGADYLPAAYLDNVAQRVEAGGALMVIAGPEFTGVRSVANGPLARVLPGQPTGGVRDDLFTPALTEAGARHPVTAPLRDVEPGPWARQIPLRVGEGATLLEGDGPLFHIAETGEGRVGLMGSDQVWLWARDYEGGGPYRETMRRIAHWLMKAPELEAEQLEMRAEAGALIAERRSLSDAPPPLVLTGPEGEDTLDWSGADGVYTARLPDAAEGIWQGQSGDLQAAAFVGAARTAELDRVLRSETPLAAQADAAGGAFVRLDEETPRLRRVEPGRRAYGRGWIGAVARDAQEVTNITAQPALPPWAWLLLISAALALAWLRMPRRR
ncbi:hypothetical protein ACMA5I_14185 [Paracoccaceae bacterium GXU_MW_L88]